jgi:hypothetical protein
MQPDLTGKSIRCESSLTKIFNQLTQRGSHEFQHTLFKIFHPNTHHEDLDHLQEGTRRARRDRAAVAPWADTTSQMRRSILIQGVARGSRLLAAWKVLRLAEANRHDGHRIEFCAGETGAGQNNQTVKKLRVQILDVLLGHDEAELTPLLADK